MQSDNSRASWAARQERACWVAQHIMPAEPRIRRWLSRWQVSPDDRDEILQEAYCRIAMLDDVEHIANPSGYFFSIVRNLLARRKRKESIVSLELIAEVEAYQDTSCNSLEDQTAERLLYEKVVSLIDNLPRKCREVIRLRQIERWSHKQIAEHLGVSPKTVEAHVRTGLRAVRYAWEQEAGGAAGQLPERAQPKSVA